MIGWLMRRCKPGGFAWLTLHELRLAVAARAKRSWQRFVAPILLLVWTGAGVLIALAIQHVPILAGPALLTGAAAAAILVFSFMTTQAMLASQRTLFEAGDLDLLFSAPLAPRAVVAAKLAGIAGTVALSFAAMILPIVLPVAILGHPQLLGIPALLLALTLAAACTGLALTLALARIAWPRAARTVGQIIAALLGGAVFIASQLLGHAGDGRRAGFEDLFERMLESGFGSSGFGALPGQAAFGDPLATALLLGAGVLVFALTAAGMQTLFLASYRAGGMKLGRTRTARGGIARHFRPSLFATVFAKEWRLLARDPALAFQIVLRLVYLAPLFLLAFRPNGGIPLAPALAVASVVIAGQVVGSFAWLAVSGEDTPDLIRLAPADKAELDHAKLMAAMAMAAPLFVVLPVVIALETIPGALATLAITAFAGWLTGQIEVAYAKPAPRSAIGRRQSGSLVRGIFEMSVTLFLGVVAGALVYLL